MRVFSSRKIISIAITVLSIVGYGFIVFAAVGPFAPGEELDPLCIPGAPNCVVQQLFATTNSTYTWIGEGVGANGGSTDNTFFAGIGAGDGAVGAHHSNFVGTDAGIDAVGAYNSNFFGPSSGCGAVGAYNSNFFGDHAGCYALNANNSNFFGDRAGYTAVDAKRSVFFGDHAGYFATGAARSNYIGYWAGAYVTGGYNSNFLGYRSGMGATGANNSTFMGYEAGSGPELGVDGIDTIGAVGAENSLLIGYHAGYNSLSEPDFLTTGSNGFGLAGDVTFIGNEAGLDASGAVLSTFVGLSAGSGATYALASNFFGTAAGFGAINANSSNFIGNSAGSGATGANGSTFVGNFAGVNALHASNSIFMGARAGDTATDAHHSIFLGNAAGSVASKARNSIFMGFEAGYHATNAYGSSFLGNGAGRDGTNSYESVFMGTSSGRSASDAPFSTFIGFDSGNMSTYASNSIFLGHNAGYDSDFASNAIFIGPAAGQSDPVDNDPSTITYSGLTGQFLVGELVTNSNTGSSFYIFNDNGSVLQTDRVYLYGMNPGDQLVGYTSGATATIDSHTDGTYSILIGHHTTTQGYKNSIALGAEAYNNASNQFKIGSQSYPINELYIQSSGGACVAGVTGFSCSSDERLKKNISDLEPVLDTLDKVRTVHYKWKVGDTDQHIGFLAQDLMQYFPELVRTDSEGYYLVNYANMTPLLVQAVRELNLKIGDIENFASAENKTFLTNLMDWLGDEVNGLALIISDTIKARNEICIDDVCMTKDQLRTIIDNNVSTSYGYGYGNGQ